MVVRFATPPPQDNVEWHEFLSLDSPHPYGVLPAGNRLLQDDNETTSSSSPNEPFFGRIRDETWLSVLGFCDGTTLGSVVQTCRFFYVAGHQPELWRDLVLRKLHSSGKSMERFGNSWKDTYVMMQSSGTLYPSRPMSIPGIYSDDLYRLHSCRAFAIPPSWLDEENATISSVPAVPVEKMTIDEFRTHYEMPNRPVIIKGAAKTWKAFENWQDPAYLREHTKGRTFRATSGAAPLPADFTLKAFQEYISTPVLEEAPLYLFDREALKPGGRLHQDFFPDLQRTCPYFDPSRTLDDPDDEVGHDLFQVLGEGKRPDCRWIIIGGSHTGSVFHIDPNCTHAWNACIAGRKRWLFYPPGEAPPGVHPSGDGDEVALPLSIGEWILTFWREHQHRKKTRKPAQRPIECTAFPGDVVFVPHGWWHSVINLDQTNIALTFNFVSRSNLGDLLRFLKRKEDQISGCRDREESIKPDQLHSAMVAALQERFGKENQWLVEAQKQADDRWTCNAWKDDNDEVPKKRSLEEVKGVTGQQPNEAKKLATSGTSVMCKAKEATSGDAPFSFSFL